jgi:hypothetical protein
MSNYDDRLKDYVDVKDRIKLFYDKHPDGRLTTADVTIHTDPDGEQRVMVKALAYRTPDDPVPGAGHSWMVLPGSTPYTKGSEVENTETSAWGRAIGSLGIGIDKSIASGDEVRGKAGEGDRKSKGADEEIVTLIGVDTLSGTIAKGGSDKYLCEWRDHPDGHVIGFAMKRTKAGKDFPQVGLLGRIGEGLYLTGDFPQGTELIGQKVTVKGRFYSVRAPLPEGGHGKAYPRVIVGQGNGDYIEVGDWRIPPATEANPEGVQPLRDPEQDVIPVAEGQESFDLTESQLIDAEAARA